MKLLTLLKAIRQDEHREFEKFLQSPFFKASEQYLAFFKYLCKHHPGFELDREALETAYRRCFGARSFADTKLYNLMHGMARQAEQYITVKQVMDPRVAHESHLYQSLLIKALADRNAGAYFRAEAAQLVMDIEALTAKSSDDYLAMEQLYYELYFNPDTPKHTLDQPALHLAADNLDLYYCVSKLRYIAEMKARERMLGANFSMPPMLEALLALTDDSSICDKHPLLAVYSSLVHMYLAGVTEDRFRAVKAMFADKFVTLPNADQRMILTHLINCGVTLNSNEMEVNDEMLELYKIAVATNMLLDNERITHVTFTNIVAVAALCKDYDWAKSFIDDFSPYLEVSKQKPAIAFSHALIYYQQGNLDAAQTSLVAEIFPIIIFDIAARVLLLKIVFDRYLLDVLIYDFVEDNINSFEKFVINKELLTDTKRTSLLGFIRMVRKMLKLKNELVQVPQDKKDQLLKRLEATPAVVSKKWLREKIGQL
jgi:hypothetical protein